MFLPLLAALVGALVLVGLALLALDRFALKVIRPPHVEPERPVQDLPFDAEAVEFRGGAGGDYRLHGWIGRPEKDDPSRAVVLLTHGWGYTTDKLVPLAAPLVARGHPVFAFDVRGHGASDPAPYVTIRHYRDDIVAAAGFAEERFPDRVRVLMGHSMGGGAAVLAVAEGAPVHGVGVLAGPADIREITELHLESMGLPGGLLVPLCMPFWKRRAGVGSFDELSPEQTAPVLEIPMAVFQGTEDGRVPLDHARRLAEAGFARFEILEGEGHTRILESQALHRVVADFLDQVVAGR